MPKFIGQPVIITRSGESIRADGTASSEIVWEGIPSATRGIFNWLRSRGFQPSGTSPIGYAGSDIDMESGQTKSRVSIQSVGGGYTAQAYDTFQLVSNAAQVDIFTPPFPDAIKDLTVKQVKLIRKAVNDDDFNLDSVESNPDWNDDMRALYILVEKGLQYRPVFAPVLTKTSYTPGAEEILLARQNVGKILSRSQVLQDCGLADSLASRILPDESEETPYDGFTYGWKKYPPELFVAANNTAQIIYQYHYGLWADIVERFAV